MKYHCFLWEGSTSNWWIEHSYSFDFMNSVDIALLIFWVLKSEISMKNPWPSPVPHESSHFTFYLPDSLFSCFRCNSLYFMDIFLLFENLVSFMMDYLSCFPCLSFPFLFFFLHWINLQPPPPIPLFSFSGNCMFCKSLSSMISSIF